VSRSRLALALALALTLAFAVAAPAQAWKYKFNEFFDSATSANGTANATALAKAKKCKGGPIGTYEYTSFAASSNPSTLFDVEVRAKLSARPKFRRMRDVEVTVKSSPGFDPGVIEETSRAVSDFHESIETRWKGPGKKLGVRHGPFIIFGNETLAAGEEKIKFKPKEKPGC
ncbi:MAG: hypothetical protein M3O25_05930, partial [Actinomycetota bacterium]|nr:hypothetical protein [Actinomycetota bacterium]